MAHSRFRALLAAAGTVGTVALLWFAVQTGAQPVDDTVAEDPPVFVMPRSGPFAPEAIGVPNTDVITSWARSAHSDASSEAFSHWDAEGAIPSVCATCHSGIGFRAFHGLDGSAPGLPEEPVQTGGVVDCDTCHNPGLASITEITLPSGVQHPVAPAEASCTTCHSGRAAGTTVAAATGEKPLDQVDPALRFINPHYAIAALSRLGSYGGGGFHYPGRSYSGRFLHARPVETCVSCHEPHALEVAETTCLTCHQTGDPAEIRISRQSYDGSGDTSKGIRADIDANHAVLMDFMQDYARQVAGTALVYDGARYPYFFADANGDGVADTSDGSLVAYDAWTPRLLRATYNWKFVDADGGIHVHNPHYALELLHDSIADLAGPLEVDFDALGLAR